MTNSDIDPHWRSTHPNATTGATRVPVHASEGAAMRQISRTPAAVMGIVLVSAIGLLLTRGWTGVIGQLPSSGTGSVAASSSIIVTLTDDGVDAPCTDVQVGSTVIFRNDSSSPQIIESRTLTGDDGELLYSSAIYPGSEYAFTVGDTGSETIHVFTSITDDALEGTLVITTLSRGRTNSDADSPFGSTDGVDLLNLGEGRARSTGSTCAELAASAAASSVPSAASETSENVESESSASAAIALNTQASSSIGGANGSASSGGSVAPENGSTSNGGGAIAVNPYTVGAAGQNTPAGSDGSLSTRPVARATGTAHNGPVPLSQPATGPEAWIAVALSLGVLLMTQRRTLTGIR